MRILYITHITLRNGSPIALLHLMKEMKEKGNEIALVVPERNGWLYEECTKEDITIFDIGCYYHWLIETPKANTFIQKIKSYYHYSRQLLSLQVKFYHLIKEYKPDIVHCNNGTIDYALLGCYLLKIPHVWHIREYQDLDFHFNIFLGMRFLKWKMHRQMNHCIAITQGIFNYFQMGAKDTVIYDGVIDDSIPIMQKNRKYSFPYFLFVGAICEGKGLHVLIKQYATFHQHNSEIHLVISGFLFEGDKYTERCQQMVRECNLTNFVHFIGYCNDVYSLMAYAKALIVPSYFEGFGFITAEAMYNHCLVIGRNTAGTKEQFDMGKKLTNKEIGLRFDDDEELPILMRRAVTDDFSEMRRRAREVVITNYTTKINSEKIYNYYCSILDLTPIV